MLKQKIPEIRQEEETQSSEYSSNNKTHPFHLLREMELCDDEDFCSEDGEISLDLEQDEDANIQGENQAQVGDGNKELEQLEEEDSFGEHQEQNQYEANFPLLAPNAVKPKKWGPVQAMRKSTRVDCTGITMLQRAQGLK